MKVIVPEGMSFSVFTGNGTQVEHQLSNSLSFLQNGSSLFFKATVPALGYQTYSIRPDMTFYRPEAPTQTTNEGEKIFLSNDFITAQFSIIDGKLEYLSRHIEGNITQNLLARQSIRFYTPVDDLNQSSD